MTMKRLFTLAVTFFAIIGLASVAFAANKVTMSSDKPNIPYSECEEGGAVTLSMDDGTSIHEGDVITLTLSNKVTVCGNIDLYLELADDGGEALGSNVNNPVVTTDGAGILDVVFQAVDVADGVALNDGVDDYDLGLRIQASDGSRFINLTLVKRNLTTNALTVNPADDTHITFIAADSSAELIIKLFDQKTNMIWEPAVDANGVVIDPNVYADFITDFPGDEGDNVMCIDTATDNFTGDYVYAVPSSSPTSNPYQLSFFGDYIIAQMVSAVTYDVAPSCKDEICRYVAIESGVDQEGKVIPADGVFDFGDYDTADCTYSMEDRWNSDGYCDLLVNGDNRKYGNGILFSKDGDTFSNGDQFRVTMTVRVGTTADPDEVEFNNNAVGKYWTTSNEQGNCSCSADDISAQAAVGIFGWTGTDQTEMQADFTVTAAEEDYGAILFDLPQINLGIDDVVAGQKVYLDVTVAKLPCGAVKSVTICLAELIADCPSLTVSAVAIDGIAFIGDRQLTNVLHGYLGRLPGTVIGSTLTYPFVPGIDDPGFFTGLVINNMSTSDADLTITVFDKNGGSAVYSTTLNAGLQFVKTLDDMEGSLVDGTPALNRDQSGYVTVSAIVAE